MADVTVQTTGGLVRGTVDEGTVHVRGIPFAAPPIAGNRFRPPQAPEPWSGIRDCTAYGPICPQLQMQLDGPLASLVGALEQTDEDCLYLNVTTPALDDGRRPVMVWIHGGAFTGGSGSSAVYEGSNFARDDVVFVSLNYRLHALGFLYLDGLFEGASGTGNLGIFDQIAALEWVRDNIASFGGNPDEVTIFGESAGAMSVTTLLGTPAASGLFHRAIAQSGAGNHVLPAVTARRITQRVLELAGVQAGDWDALRAVPAQRFVEITMQLSYFEAPQLLGDDLAVAMVFLPVVDGVTRDRSPVDAVGAGSAAGIDLLIGTNAEECRLFVWGLPEVMQAFIPIPEPQRYFARTGHSDEEVRAAYAPGVANGDARDVDVAIWSDGMFTIPATRLADAQLPHGRVWAYRFSWRTPIAGGRLGACHALEIPFVFEHMDWVELLGEHPPAALAREMHQAWVRFARTGHPSGGDLPAWPQHDVEHRRVMNFDASIELLDDPSAAVRPLWNGAWQAAPRSAMTV